MSQHAHTAHQGHKYKFGDKDVIAMQSGYVIQVREIVDEAYPLGPSITVKASWLQPQAMKYFHGEVPV